MARSGSTDIDFNESFFEGILRSPQVEQLVDDAAASIQSGAKASAPVDTAEYRDGIVIEHKQAKHRRVTQVVATDEKSLIVESKSGNLARAVKGAAK